MVIRRCMIMTTISSALPEATFPQYARKPPSRWAQAHTSSVKYENKTVYLEANENYYKGEPKIKNMQLRESADADFIPGVEQGTIDLADPSGSKSAFEQIKEHQLQR